MRSLARAAIVMGEAGDIEAAIVMLDEWKDVLVGIAPVKVSPSREVFDAE